MDYNKEIIIGIFVVVVVIIIWKFSHKGPVSSEYFEQENKNSPNVEVKTGSLVDGPGFEKGEVDGVSQDVFSRIPPNLYFLDDGSETGGELSVQHNLCSKSCCSSQWPTPFKQKYDKYVCSGNQEYVPSKMFCNNSFQDSGCLCLTKKQAQHIYNRGTNGREWF